MAGVKEGNQIEENFVADSLIGEMVSLGGLVFSAAFANAVGALDEFFSERLPLRRL